VKSSVWIIIGALAGLWLWSRKDKAKKDGGIEVPAGANIGRIGASIENPAALQDFARSLEMNAEPRVVASYNLNNYSRQIWSDGRVVTTDGAGNLISDKPFIPSP